MKVFTVKKNGLPVIPRLTNLINMEGALLKISQTQHYQKNGMAQMMYIAAVVEMIEPSA